ncbi:MAG: hypothetical protein ACI4JI_09450 [Ruminiclostridium sp.]
MPESERQKCGTDAAPQSVHKGLGDGDREFTLFNIFPLTSSNNVFYYISSPQKLNFPPIPADIYSEYLRLPLTAG